MKKLASLVALLAIFFSATSSWSQSGATAKDPITPVSGESWLNHLHRSFNTTSMGKTWDMPPSSSGSDESRWQLALTPGFAANAVTVQGSDLYRFNCQACHGPSGAGSPPEINSVIGPVQASSAAVIMERAKKSGQDMTPANAATLAKQARDLLLERFHKGGQSMPAFPQLDEAEIHAIIAYLDQLAGVPGAEKGQVNLKESPYRVGEQIIKSTCHICHNAGGPEPTAAQLMQGAIPPLSSLTMRTNLNDFIRKVTNGSPITMGQTPNSYKGSYRGRMPVFRYLTQDEAADAYLYLTVYPPKNK